MRNFVKLSSVALLAVLLSACYPGQKDAQLATPAPEASKPVLAQAPEPASSVKWDGFSIQAVGQEAKYPIYPLDGNMLDDDRWVYRSTVYGVDEMMKALPAIQVSDVDANGYHCEFLCANAQNQVVGWNPNYRAIIAKARKGN